jgi:hypothetical protein
MFQTNPQLNYLSKQQTFHNPLFDSLIFFNKKHILFFIKN